MRKFLRMYRLPRLLWIVGLVTGLSLPLVSKASASAGIIALSDEKEGLYEQLNLKTLGLSHQAFTMALKGFQKLVEMGKVQKDNLLSILDFSLPSGKKRLFVIDLAAGQLMFHTYAAHGKKSGTAIPTKFSNKVNSNKSSLGFYLTGETYNGSHGESLRLVGEEKGINDKALQRGIVMHSASYVDEAAVESQGFIGRSQGCPAIPKDVYLDVIETIKDGSCLFMYSPDKFYLSHSKILRGKP